MLFVCSQAFGEQMYFWGEYETILGYYPNGGGLRTANDKRYLVLRDDSTWRKANIRKGSLASSLGVFDIDSGNYAIKSDSIIITSKVCVIANGKCTYAIDSYPYSGGRIATRINDTLSIIQNKEIYDKITKAKNMTNTDDNILLIGACLAVGLVVLILVK